MGGEDAIDAALHLLSRCECSVPKPPCCLGIPDPELGRPRVLGGHAREHQANILAAVCPTAESKKSCSRTSCCA